MIACLARGRDVSKTLEAAKSVNGAPHRRSAQGSKDMTESWDVFICHASEDKEGFVKPLAEGLRRLGVAVWYDEFTLEVGDSLSKAIDRG